MFRKIVAIEPVSLIPSAEKDLYLHAEEVVLYNDIPNDDDEIVKRIADADAVLLSYTSSINQAVLEKCPQLKYIGMCCSLYSPESANVDIRFANKQGITVTGIRDYGDEGVVEYVISEFVRCLHGFGQASWNGTPREITGLKAGIIGLGKSGGMIADALKFFGAEVSYYSRTEKEFAKEKGYQFLNLHDLLEQSEVVFCCLNKNTVLLHDQEFEKLGDKKILFNTGLSPAWDEKPFLKWLEGNNLCYCDTVGALGGVHLLTHKNVRCMQVSSGRTIQAFDRLSEKVLANLSEYNGRNDIQ
ncbi:MAG: dihydrofolate reductase [Bacteroidia bacterium]|nr:NAD(P)-dependent oxidoreductase [Paludibacter sp.]MDD3489396.1 NAD(P)-dependent oxidoreductase [Paludibacter sp.]NCB69042.1 dihydrofolate reductase [Bacteroidia bacterium]